MTYPTEVKAIKLRSDRIVIVLMTEIKVYTFNKNSDLLHSAETYPNPYGLCHSSNPIVAYPGKQIGQVVLVNIGTQSRTTHSAQSSPPPRHIDAHKNSLAAIIMNSSGSLLATASVTGTLIRIFDTGNCQLKHELRRGMNPAHITSICFNNSNQYICVMSDHGTAHVFDLHSASRSNTSGIASNQQFVTLHIFLYLFSRTTNKIFSSHISKIKCHLDTKFKCVCAFSECSPNTLIILAANGSYYKYTFTPNGSVTRETSCSFLHLVDDCEELI
ncbi:WD repeat domain phosphoinositide-interacting protein 3 [Cichlidogyrus casuarinus]|uniref:WD repeat domain phosphoinositide-interacting protein 3 n=1 Tax=Cichlidogyrus casuarinus TaxID=1844966 RepID=A0ABD2Q373_9PLAT